MTLARSTRFGLAVLLLSTASLLGSSATAATHVNVATISGSINVASADFLISAVKQSESESAAALLIELDTPGGMVNSTKDIIQAILNSTVPVIVYVSPRGAWAASAGTFITVSAHIAAMAPSTSIGAAHPVAIPIMPQAPPPPAAPGTKGAEDDDEADPSAPAGGAEDPSMQKMENMLIAYMESIAKERSRNVEWVVDAIRNSVAVDQEEALRLGVIDLVAENRTELFEIIEGREVEVAGALHTMSVQGAEFVALEMTPVQIFFDFLASPNLITILMLAAVIGIYVEVNNPGLIVPGAIGVTAGVLFLISLQQVPFSWVGLLIMLLGMGLLVAEVFVASFGTLFAAGIVCFLVGGTMMFDTPELSDLTVSFWEVLVPAVLGVAVFGGVVVLAVGRTLFAPSISGIDELIGLTGRAASALNPTGKVFIRGEYWDVVADETIDAETSVEVIAVEGMTLRVRRAPMRA